MPTPGLVFFSRERHMNFSLLKGIAQFTFHRCVLNAKDPKVPELKELAAEGGSVYVKEDEHEVDLETYFGQDQQQQQQLQLAASIQTPPVEIKSGQAGVNLLGGISGSTDVAGKDNPASQRLAFEGTTVQSIAALKARLASQQKAPEGGATDENGNLVDPAAVAASALNKEVPQQ